MNASYLCKVRGFMTSALILLYVLAAKGQHTEDKAYGLMLKGLLSHTAAELDVNDAARMKHAVFLDARETNEYHVSHIRNAVYVGYDHFSAKRISSLSHSDTLIVYCSVGYRSEKICERLKALGYTHVYNLYGGIFEWKNRGLPVYLDGSETNRVHAYNRSWGIWLKKGEKVYH